ncbi:MAG: HlyD family efflux transporter periplasmic adaptor subunit [Romboutsia sp.]
MRKIKHTKVLTVIILVCILLQLAGSVFAKSIDTLVLKNEKTDMKINTKGLLIRDEYSIYSNLSGKVEFLVADGDKIRKSQDIVRIHGSNKSENLSKEIESLDGEINRLRTGKDNISKEDIKNLNEEIDILSEKIQQDVINKNSENINMNKLELDKIIKERNRLLNNNIDSKKLETKEKQREILSTKLNKNMSTISSNISGIISYKFDGNEEIYRVENLDNITKNDIVNTDNNYKTKDKSGEKVENDEPILRIINADSTYVAICVDKDIEEIFEVNKSVKLNYNKNELDAKVDRIHHDKENIVIIFKISNQNVGFYDTRVEEFDIIYKQIEGLKIPKSSIDTVNGKKGIYVVSQETKKPNFVVLEGVVYEDDNYIYIDHYKNSTQGIKSINLYDEIILKPNSISKNMKIK